MIFAFDQSPVALGSFDLLIELFGQQSYRIQERIFSFESISSSISDIIHEIALSLREKMLGCSSWRVSGVRKDIAGERQDFRSKDLELLTTEAIRVAFGAASGDTLLQHGLPPVALSGFDLEVVIWARGGVLAIGWSDPTLSRLIYPPTRLLVCKGENGDILSKAADATAFVLAGTALLEYEAGIGRLGSTEVRCGDPMCGVGTCLFALHYIISAHFPAARPASIGSDAAAVSVAQAIANLRRLPFDPSMFSFQQCAAEEVGRSGVMPLNGMDVLVVDPPWGHRHGSFADICRRTPAWARQWVAVLRCQPQALSKLPTPHPAFPGPTSVSAVSTSSRVPSSSTCPL